MESDNLKTTFTNNNWLEIDEAIKSSAVQTTIFITIGVLAFIFTLSQLFGVNWIIINTLPIPILALIFNIYLIKKNRFGIGFLLILITSYIHVFIVVVNYNIPNLELLFLFLSVVPWMYFLNIKALTICHFSGYIFYLLTGYYTNNYDLSNISNWSKSEIAFYVIINALFIYLFIFLRNFSIANSDYKKKILTQNTEIEKQNDLIKLNTKMLLKLEEEKHKANIENKQKDLELFNINNQRRFNLKTDLLKDLQKIRRSTDINKGLLGIINKLKYQIEEERKFDVIQNNVDMIGSDFNSKLKEHFDNLSHSDTELLSLIKLKLTNKQIAIQKNTTPNTINVAIHRLRKKCGFESSIKLKKFIENL